jgi:hypothetical protein
MEPGTGGHDEAADSYDEGAGILFCTNGGRLALSPVQRVILCAIHRGGHVGVALAEIVAAVYSGSSGATDERNAIGVHIYLLRRRLVGCSFRIDRPPGWTTRYRIVGRLNWISAVGRRCPYCARPL